MTQGIVPTERGPAFRRLVRSARSTLRKSPGRIRHSLEKRIVLQRLEVARAALKHLLGACGWQMTAQGCDRTAYVIGLYGTGRHYINELIGAHLGRRAIYLIEGL